MAAINRQAAVALAFAWCAAWSTESSAAASDEALAKKNDCFGCHAVATKVVGPAYRDVATKYAGQADAEDQLVHSIRDGSSGKWGEIPMPAHPKLSDADAHRLAKWILDSAK